MSDNSKGPNKITVDNNSDYELTQFEGYEEMAPALPPEKETNTLERYPLNEPYAYARITKDPNRGNTTYVVEEPELYEVDAQHLANLREILTETLNVKAMDLGSQEEARKYLIEKSGQIMKQYKFKSSDESKEKLLYYLIRDTLGFEKIDPLMHDALIEDISCDGTDIPIYIWHRQYESIPTNIRFKTAEQLESFAQRLAYLCGRHISIAQPMLDASLPDGSRINLTYGTEVTRRGSTFSIRKFKSDPLTIVDIINFNTLSPEIAAFFWYAVENRVSILVSGGIAAGKTTMLNCLSMFVRPDMKIVSIEDTPELNLPHENWIPSTTRTHFGLGTETADITLFDLLQSALRQRPDYIIVGEVRGKETYTLFQAISTGHLGMSTIHGESVDAIVYRLESEPMNIPRTLIAGIDLITVQQRAMMNGKPGRRTIVTSEVVGLDPRSREILTNEVYKWKPATDTYEYTGRSYLLERIAEKNGIDMDEIHRELQRRSKIIQWMQKKNIRNYKEVSEIIRGYYENPELTYAEAVYGE